MARLWTALLQLDIFRFKRILTLTNLDDQLMTIHAVCGELSTDAID